MGIEYLSGIRPGTKIDLSKFETKAKEPSPETYLPILRERLYDLSKRLNKEYGDFIDSNGQVKMVGPESNNDIQSSFDKESIWARDYNKTREVMLSDREKNPATIAEMVTTLLFDKILSKQFIVVRASTHDDYENGADQLIIDKETGVTICGIDDAILGSSVKDDGEKKRIKIDRKMKNGGAQIKYGLTINNGDLERTSLNHVPIFYFNLEKKEMNEVLKHLGSEQIDMKEFKVYARLVDSLKNQVNEYKKDYTLNKELRNNIIDFEPSLYKMLEKKPC